MFTVTQKLNLNDSVTQMTFYAPAVAKKAMAGQFVVLRVEEKGERIPLTISHSNAQKGEITVVFQVVGDTTKELNDVLQGQSIADLAGPLGKPTVIDQNLERVCVIGGGVGNAIAFAVANAFKQKGVSVDLISGYRNKDLIIMCDELKSACQDFYLVTDDGSAGEKGFVTTKLEQLIESGVQYGEVFAVGPVVMMRAVANLTKKYGIKTTVSLNPIMVDGIGMCGCCRVTVNGKVEFACVDGPDFDAHGVDFDSLIKRNNMYEGHKKPHACNLTGEIK